MATKDTAVAKSNGFNVPAIANDMKEIIQESFAGESDLLEFPRATVMAGGVGFFNVPDEFGEDESVKVLEGVIIYAHAANAYWSPGTDGAPDCFSNDGITGYDRNDRVYRPCHKCPYNEFGSYVNEKGEHGRGKACKTGYRVYLLRDGETFPIILSIPPTSRRAVMKRLTKMFVMRNRPMHSAVVQFSLMKQENSAGQPYSVVSVNVKKDANGNPAILDPDTVSALGKYAEIIKDTVSHSDERAYTEPEESAPTGREGLDVTEDTLED
jgi:hypothetical protein